MRQPTSWIILEQEVEFMLLTRYRVFLRNFEDKNKNKTLLRVQKLSV